MALNNLPSYLLTYSPGDNAKGDVQMFRAENDADALAVARCRCPKDTVAWRVERISQTHVLADGAAPNIFDDVIASIHDDGTAAEIAARFAPERPQQ